jgi:hypothetical protein
MAATLWLGADALVSHLTGSDAFASRWVQDQRAAHLGASQRLPTNQRNDGA